LTATPQHRPFRVIDMHDRGREYPRSQNSSAKLRIYHAGVVMSFQSFVGKCSHLYRGVSRSPYLFSVESTHSCTFKSACAHKVLSG
jgi:hypothetical protein